MVFFMKNLSIVILSMLVISCQTGTLSSGEERAMDTLQTASGLRYAYLKRGEGRSVAPGSRVSTILSLKVGDRTVWNSYSAPDSLFTFIAGTGQVIRGFDEMAMLMRRGDQVVAILPDSLAYGSAGAGDVIPPNATLVYDRFEVVDVGQPKGLAMDTLYRVVKEEGLAAMKARFRQMSGDTVGYHPMTERDDLELLNKLTEDSLFVETFEIANFLGRIHRSARVQAMMTYALEQQGQNRAARDTLESVLLRFPTAPQMQSWKQRLKILEATVANAGE